MKEKQTSRVNLLSRQVLQDLLQLDHLGDIGMSEMIFLMRLHVQEVARFSTLIGYRLRLSEAQVMEFRQDCAVYEIDPVQFLQEEDEEGTPLSVAGLQLLKICAKVHDIGKPFFRQIYIQERGLTDKEFNLQKLHANLSRLIVKGWLNYPELNFHNPQLIHMVADFSAQHQEKYDGSGYPDRLVGKEISLLGRLLAITDAISAIVNPRPYEVAIALDECIVRLEKDRGNHFDPELLDQSLSILQHEVSSAPRFSGEWENLNQHSTDYINFVRYIDFERISAETGRVGRGDRQYLPQLQEQVEAILNYHDNR